MVLNFAVSVIFWVSLATVLYVYVGYPLLVYVLGYAKPAKLQRTKFEPTVSIVITAFNEAKDLREKLENTLLIEYPREKVEIIVASDASTDETDEIARGFEDRNVRVVRQPERKGKTSAQNLAVERSSGEIILFSDATTLYDPGVLNAILPNFGDPSVGCVAGRLLYQNPDGSGMGDAARGYWSYETFIKKNESLTGSLIGVSGCLYAVRRSAYVPMYPEACSDFLIASVVRRQGMRTIFEGDALSFERTNRDTGNELKMRVRVISQTLNDLKRNSDLLNPFRYGFYAVQLISHKLLRYLVPVFLLTLYASSSWLATESYFFLICTILQICFYAVAVASLLLERVGVKIQALSFPHYFVLTGVASLLGFLKFFRGEHYSVWEPIRD